MKDIIFVTSPKNANSRVLPFYYLCLAAWLEKEGISSDILDIKINKFFKAPVSRYEEGELIGKIVEHLRVHPPLAVGLSCFTTEYATIMALAYAIKEHTDTRIIVGNAHATISPGDFIYPTSPVDFVVIGEGEITLTELIRAIKNHEPFESIDGIAFLRGDRAYFTNPRYLINDLRELPLPSYQKVDMEYYLKPNIMLIRNLFLSGVHIYTGRGCPFSCEFCAANTIWKKNRSKTIASAIRFRPVEEVVGEIDYLYQHYHIDGFYILDDTFTVDRKRVVMFLEEYKKKNLPLVWAAQTRVNLVDEEMVQSLEQNGCIQLDFGVESGSQVILDRIQKGIRIGDIRATFDLCRKHGMRTFATILVNNPGETLDDIRETENLMKDIRATRYGISVCTPYPGTAIYAKHIAGNLPPESYQLLTEMRLFFQVDSQFNLTQGKLDLEKIISRLRRQFFEFQSFNHFTSNLLYWRVFLRSRRRFQYFTAWLEFTLGRLKESTIGDYRLGRRKVNGSK